MASSSNSTKKQRRPNWDTVELTKLVEGVEKYHKILFGKFSQSVTQLKKNQSWEDIAMRINAIRGLGRTADECSNKWCHIKSEAKKREKERIKYRNGTGGGPAPKEASELDLKVLKLMPQEILTGIPGGLEVSGSKHVTVIPPIFDITLDQEEVERDCSTPIAAPVTTVSASPEKKKKKTDEDSLFQLMKEQILVDKERNEIMKKAWDERRKFEVDILKVQKDILGELKKHLSPDDNYQLLLQED